MYGLNYTSDIEYVCNKRIYEYDMKSGGYSITISDDLIDNDEVLERLLTASKKDKQIILGLYSKNNREYVKALNEGFRFYMSEFIKANAINRNKILSIKKDAIFYFGEAPIRLKFNKVEFSRRSVFSSFMRLGKIEFYLNSRSKQKVVKGLPGSLPIEDTIVSVIFDIMLLAEFQPKRVVATKIEELRERYVKRELTDSYYRDLSANANYNYRYDENIGSTVRSNFVFNEDSIPNDEIDITYNYLNFIVPLCRLFLN